MVLIGWDVGKSWGGRSAAEISSPGMLHLFAKKHPNASDFSALVAYSWPSESAISGVSVRRPMPLAHLSFVHHCLLCMDPFDKLRRRLSSLA